MTLLPLDTWIADYESGRLPPDSGHDPDSYIRAHGVAAFCALIGRPPPPPVPHIPRDPSDAQHVRQVRERGASNRDLARPPVESDGPVLAYACGERCQCFDCVWERIGDMVATQPGYAAWYEEGYRAAWEKRERAREEERQRRELAELRRRLAREHKGPTPEARASAWLAYREACGARAFDAVVGVVRGFGLGAERGFALLWSEYAPRFRKGAPLTRRALEGMVRRAMRYNMAWGKMLEEGRR